jgi:hypothetical protein
MAQIDRELNIEKVNILTEEIKLQRGDVIVWIKAPKVIGGDVTVQPGQKGEYIGKQSSGEYVVVFGNKRFYANGFEFEKS